MEWVETKREIERPLLYQLSYRRPRRDYSVPSTHSPAFPCDRREPTVAGYRTSTTTHFAPYFRLEIEGCEFRTCRPLQIRWSPLPFEPTGRRNWKSQPSCAWVTWSRKSFP